MFNLIFIIRLHLGLLMKLFLIIFKNNKIFHFHTLIQLGITLLTLLLLIKNFFKLSHNYLTTKLVVLQALVMKCLNISVLNAPLLLLLFLITVFLKTEFLNNEKIAKFILSLSKI